MLETELSKVKQQFQQNDFDNKKQLLNAEFAAETEQRKLTLNDAVDDAYRTKDVEKLKQTTAQLNKQGKTTQERQSWYVSPGHTQIVQGLMCKECKHNTFIIY